MRQQQKNTWAAHQISLRQFFSDSGRDETAIQTPIVESKAVHVFGAVMKLIEAPIHKARPRATPRSLSFCAMIFLLRRANCQKAEPEGLLCSIAHKAGFDRYFVANKIHRRINVAQGLEAETRPKLLGVIKPNDVR